VTHSAIRIEIGTRSAQSIFDTPVAWMFFATLVTFLIARLVTRRIRAHSERPPDDEQRGIVGDISLGGVHIHHQVFGILIMLTAGLILISATPQGRALCVVSAVFGVGVGLTFDEFALWLHLKDVYWANEGRASIDAMFCVLVISGVLIGGANLVTGSPGSGSWWLSIALLLVIFAFSVVCMLKGKIVTGAIGIFLSPIAIVGAIRLAKPDSWWAQRRYSSRPKRRARAEHRFGETYQRRWNRLRDLVAGAPTTEPQPLEPARHEPEADKSSRA
jgi:hypothetical protein